MKIAFLLYGLIQNGGNTVLFRVGNGLQRRGHEVVYYVAEPEQELPFPSICSFVFAEREYPNAIGRIRWLTTRHIEADAAIATFHPTSIALQLNRSPVSKKLYYVQAYEPEFYTDSTWHLVRRWPMMLMAGASYLLPLTKVVNCDGSRRGLSWRDRESAPECPPGIDLNLYRPSSRAKCDLVIGHIGRREHWKGSDDFFRAMVELRRAGHEFRVRVAYDLWPETHGLEYEAVHPRDERELSSFYSSLDVLVSTVRQKGFGLPPLEAMASGAVCLSTPIDFGRPMVDHIPILPCSARSIVEAMKRYLEHHGKDRIVSAGFETAQRYSWDRIIDRWCSLLEAGSQ